MLVSSSCIKNVTPQNKPKENQEQKEGQQEEEQSGDDPAAAYEDWEDSNTNVSGFVVDDAGNPIEGCAVSDGLNTVVTDAKGHYGLKATLTKAKFIFVSVPAKYEVPAKNCLPQHYKSVSSLKKNGSGNYRGVNFALTRRIVAANDFTIFVYADPQPRAASASYDKIGYHSLEIADDVYSDIADVAAATSGEKFSLVLGDLVHENMDLYANYKSGVKKTGVTTHQVIGNHDNDTKASDDDAGAKPFESHFGPRNYSFNVGEWHFVMVDNLIMKLSGSKLSDYSQGLTDDFWTWLQGDLEALCPKAERAQHHIMICSHSPMFMIRGSDYSAKSSTKHGTDYASLLSQFGKVYSWGGHHHNTFNYVYPESNMRKNIEQHTVARCTGRLWTNDWVNGDGTPRGYVIVKVKGTSVSWQYKCIDRQTGTCQSGSPAYLYRPWNYASGYAVLKDNGNRVDTSLQMTVYDRGLYGDNNIYANVWMYDGRWELPVLKYDNGKQVEFKEVTDESRMYDYGYKENHDHYTAYSSTYSGTEMGTTSARSHIFYVAAPTSSGGGTVEVTDRFGNVYTASVKW